MQNMRRVLAALAFTLAFNSLASAQLLDRIVDVDGVTRQYLVYLPAGYDESSRMPVMLTYHGGAMTALDMLLMADMRPLADTNGFILVYPQGLLEDGVPIWNSEGPFSNGVDEMGFTAAMIDALAAEFTVDQSRVYASGYSNGANLVWELGCLLSDRITAVGAVAGSMWTWTRNLCAPLRPVPVQSIHGTLDFYNPYYGGLPFSLGLIAASQYWVQHNGADTTPIVVDVPDTVPGDGSTVEYYTWANGDNCISVEHYKVIGGGHDWPGVFGNMDIDSNQVIWDFVSRYDLFGRIDCSDRPLIGGITADLLPNVVTCRNLDTVDTVVLSDLGSEIAWDCSGAGLAAAPGERVAQSVRGMASCGDPGDACDVGASVTGVFGIAATCRNLDALTAITVPLVGDTTADCGSAGLQAVDGDDVQIIIRGVVQ